MPEYVDGGNLRPIARRLGVVYQTVFNGVAAPADALPARPDAPVETAELADFYTFSGDKNACYGVTEVDRKTRCITGWAVVWERSWEMLQEVVEGAVPARLSYSAAVASYQTWVSYPGRHASAPGKSQTDSVKADNADLRH